MTLLYSIEMKLILPIDLERVPKWAKVTIGILVAVLFLIIIIKANENEVRAKTVFNFSVANFVYFHSENSNFRIQRMGK